MKKKYNNNFKFEDLFFKSGFRKHMEVESIRKHHTSEGSAYWGHGKAANDSSEDNESPIANPDMLSDENKYSWSQVPEMSEESEECIQAYHRLMSKGFLESLPNREKQIWELAFLKWIRPAEICTKLKLNRSTVETYIRRVGKKLQKAIRLERGLKDE